MFIETKFNKKSIESLKKDGIGIIPTDTIYGIVGCALSPNAVRKIYRVRQRNPKKPMIILISKISDLKLFDIKLDTATKSILNKLWPARVSVILPSYSPKFKYLRRVGKTLSFRLPNNRKLRSFISKTGPLVAPSANPEGLQPAKNISEAKKYFGGRVSFYIDSGSLNSKPSKIVAIENGKIITIRK